MNYETITVGILSNRTIKFVLNGDFSTSNGTSFSGKYKAKYKEGKVLFNDESFDEIIFHPISENASFDLIDVVIGINFHWERKENQRFKGSLKFIVEEKKLTAINCIDVEDYLTSVISSEMSATASEELLKAHAVISRSWLLCPIQKQEVRGKGQVIRGKRQGVRGKEQESGSNNNPTTNYKLQTTNYQLPTQ